MNAINRLVGKKTNKAAGFRNEPNWKRKTCPAPTAEHKTASNYLPHLELNPSPPLSLGLRLFQQWILTSGIFLVFSRTTRRVPEKHKDTQVREWTSALLSHTCTVNIFLRDVLFLLIFKEMKSDKNPELAANHETERENSVFTGYWKPMLIKTQHWIVIWESFVFRSQIAPKTPAFTFAVLQLGGLHMTVLQLAETYSPTFTPTSCSGCSAVRRWDSMLVLICFLSNSVFSFLM